MCTGLVVGAGYLVGCFVGAKARGHHHAADTFTASMYTLCSVLFIVV